MLEKNKEVLKSEDILRYYKTSDREEWVKNFIKDREYFFGEQFSQAIKEAYEAKGLMAASINETLPAIGQIISDLTQNPPRFTATAAEDSDVKVANHVAYLFDWIHYKSNGDRRTKAFTSDFIKGGMGCLFTYPDYEADNGKGEIKFKDLDPIHVYIDPNSKEPTSEDSANILFSDIVSESVIKNNWDVDLKNAEEDDSDEYSRQMADTQGQTIFPERPRDEKYYRLIERFTKVRVSRYHVYDPNSNFEKTFEKKEDYEAWRKETAVIVVEMSGEKYITDELGIREALEIYNTVGETFHMVYDQNGSTQIMPGVELKSPYVVPNSTTQIKLSTKGEFVDDGIIDFKEPKVPRVQRVFSIGGILVVNEILPISEYPIVTAMLHHNRNPYPSGDIRVIRPLQDQLNVIDQRIQAYLRLITTMRVFTNTGSGLKKKLDSGGDPMGMEVFETDLETGQGVIIPQYPPLPAGVFAARENIIRQIQRIIGAYSFQDGEVTNAPRTASGTTQIDEFMRRRAADKKKEIEESLNQLAKPISEYIPWIYNQRKMIRLMSPNVNVTINDPQEVGDDIEIMNDVTTYKFDIRVISGSMLPTNRAQERQELMRAYELGMLKDPEWWIRKTDLENIDEIIEKEGALRQAQSTIEQMDEMIKKLEGQLQTKTRENISANEQVEVEKTKTKLNKIVANTEAGTAYAQKLMKDEVKNKAVETTDKKTN